MKLYLIRHGHRGNGEQQDTLTELGIEQSKRTGKHFKNIRIDKIISGTLNRITGTTDEIIKFLKATVEYNPLLNEQSLGILQGKPSLEYKKALVESGLSEDKFRPVNGENSYDLYQRAIKFVNLIKKEKGTILVISSSGLISNVIPVLFNMPREENNNFKVGFCSISYFEIDNNIIRDFFINDLSHLIKEFEYYKK